MRGNERDKYIAWEKMTTTKRHMILMYLYRVETEPMEELNNYIETYYFNKYGTKRDDLPLAISSLRGQALKRAAYAVIGKQVEE